VGKHINIILGSLAAVLCLGLGATSGQAASFLIDKGDTTVDSKTHLEWLDLTKTSGFTYNQVLNSIGVHYADSGWHFASATEAAQLWADAGGPAYTGIAGSQASTVSNPFYTTAVYLSSLLGVTSPFPGGAYTAGYIDGTVANANNQPQAYTGFVNSVNFYYGEFGTDNQSPKNANGDNSGSFLIRTAAVATTPIPPALLLFASALGGLGFVGWRRKRSSTI
jgi:hypothetical protein